MSLSNILPYVGYGLLNVMVVIAGIQDWRMGEVSNWISIPLLVLGLIACVIRFLSQDQTVNGFVLVIVMIIITIAALLGWMGGADWKILMGLFGLWPVAGFTALFVAGAWGGIEMLRTRNPDARFPGVTAFAIAVTLTFVVQLSIINLELT